MATITLRETPASQLFERLNSYSHQHPLYKALKEFGQIIETLYILRFVDEPDIRQVVEKELNKLEHSQKFAKAVFHDNNRLPPVLPEPPPAHPRLRYSGRGAALQGLS